LETYKSVQRKIEAFIHPYPESEGTPRVGINTAEPTTNPKISQEIKKRKIILKRLCIKAPRLLDSE
jgi:hypothetical protein